MINFPGGLAKLGKLGDKLGKSAFKARFFNGLLASQDFGGLL